jgi:RNA recognition motif-containing protein
MGFVGFKNGLEGKNAYENLNNTYLDTRKILVEPAVNVRFPFKI